MSTVRPAAPAVTATPVGGGLVPAAPGGPRLQVAPLSAGAGGGVGKPIASTGTTRDWLTEEMDRRHAAGLPNLDNVSDGSADYDPDEDLDDGEAHPYVCPTCGGNGCRVCAGTGELVEWVR